MSGRRGKRREKPGRGCPCPSRTLRLGVPGSPFPVSPRFCASFWSCSAVFAPPRHRAGSEQRFLLHNPRGSFPHPASHRVLRQPPIWKGHFQSIRAPLARTEFEIISVRVLSEFYIVNTQPDLAALSLPVFLGCPGMGFAGRTPGRCAVLGELFCSSCWQRREGTIATGGNNRDRRGLSLTGRESRAREIPQRSLLAFCFLPFQPQDSRDRV